MTARGAGEVGVVEDDPAVSCNECFVECSVEVAQRATAFVAVEAEVSAGDVLVRVAGFAGARDAHDDDHLAVAPG